MIFDHFDVSGANPGCEKLALEGYTFYRLTPDKESGVDYMSVRVAKGGLTLPLP